MKLKMHIAYNLTILLPYPKEISLCAQILKGVCMVLWVVLSVKHFPIVKKKGGVQGGGKSINCGLLSVDYHLAFIYLNTNKHQKY